MKDFKAIIVIERHTLLRGLVISFLLVFPFTFIPVFFKSGFAIRPIILRIPDSTLYTFLFALITVIAALLQNYNNLVDRKKLFDRPVFNSLNFYGRIDGAGSIVSELETFLLGKIGSYYFRLNIGNFDNKNTTVLIRPLIDLINNKLIMNRLFNEFDFTVDNSVEGILAKQTLILSNNDLENDNYLKDKLLILSDLFVNLGIKKLYFDDLDLDD
jgi:hypothetical protein